MLKPLSSFFCISTFLPINETQQDKRFNFQKKTITDSFGLRVGENVQVVCVVAKPGRHERLKVVSIRLSEKSKRG